MVELKGPLAAAAVVLVGNGMGFWWEVVVALPPGGADKVTGSAWGCAWAAGGVPSRHTVPFPPVEVLVCMNDVAVAYAVSTGGR